MNFTAYRSNLSWQNIEKSISYWSVYIPVLWLQNITVSRHAFELVSFITSGLYSKICNRWYCYSTDICPSVDPSVRLSDCHAVVLYLYQKEKGKSWFFHHRGARPHSSEIYWPIGLKLKLTKHVRTLFDTIPWSVIDGLPQQYQRLQSLLCYRACKSK